jgi:hypothetical protein
MNFLLGKKWVEIDWGLNRSRNHKTAVIIHIERPARERFRNAFGNSQYSESFVLNDFVVAAWHFKGNRCAVGVPYQAQALHGAFSDHLPDRCGTDSFCVFRNV